MKRTTVLLDEEVSLLLDQLARKKGFTKARILREAIKAYSARETESGPALPSFTGSGESRYQGSLGVDAEELIRRNAKRKGWE